MHMTITDDFSALGLSEQMLAAVRAKGFETPTAIQKLTIPHLLTKTNDIIAQSQTGTGKTAAYGLPILQSLEPARGPVQAIILVPTRELALQAAEELLSYNREKRLSITAIYGGAAMSEQLRRLAKGVDIVVGTPGRVLDHIRRGTLKLENVRYLVLDEADEMLNMGFVEDVEEIMSHTSEERRVLLFSATMPERIIRLSKTYMRDTEIVRVENKQLTTDLTEQIYFEVREADKFDALTRIIDVEPEFYGIIFARPKIGADETASRLAARGYAAELVPGVPSFCAAAAAMGRALCEDGEMLHIIPATHGRAEEGLALSGSKVLMKAGRGVLRVREELRESGQLENAALVERCGMEGERLVYDMDELREPSGYFSIILVKEERR